jgi:hypothetical protein
VQSVENKRNGAEKYKMSKICYKHFSDIGLIESMQSNQHVRPCIDESLNRPIGEMFIKSKTLCCHVCVQRSVYCDYFLYDDRDGSEEQFTEDYNPQEMVCDAIKEYENIRR